MHAQAGRFETITPEPSVASPLSSPVKYDEGALLPTYAQAVSGCPE
jgi:hypothetical protein